MVNTIDYQILKVLEKSEHPLTTKEIGLRIDRSWHTVQEHCLRLQLAGKVSCFRAGRANLWSLKVSDKRV